MARTPRRGTTRPTKAGHGTPRKATRPATPEPVPATEAAADGRSATVERRTRETQIVLTLAVDGSGRAEIATGIPFLDHMLELLARHGFFDLTVKASGDLEVDYHHTVEDVGLVLGQALRQALGDKAGIRRFGEATVPLDEALVQSVVDLSGRPFLVYDVALAHEKVGLFDLELIHDFLLALANTAMMNVHVRMLSGRNPHHIVEAAFKGLARALDVATSRDPRLEGPLSTKGTLTE